MAPRPADPPPRQPRGTRSTIGEARSYTPRGRTIREQGEQRRTARAGRDADPFRPALQVVEGGRAEGDRQVPAVRRPRPAAPAEDRPAAGGRTGTRSATADGGSRTAAGRSRSASTGGRGADARTGRRDERQAGQEPKRRAAGGGRTPAGQGRSPLRRKPAARTASPAGAATKATRTARSRTGPPRVAEPRRRLRLATVMAVSLFAVIGLRLIGLQVTDAPAYAEKGLDDRLRERVLAAPRGAIYDRNGAVLADSVEARYVYVDPTRVTDPAGEAAQLSPLLGLPKSELIPKLSPHKRPDGQQSQFEWIQRGVSVETATVIKGLNLAGIDIARDERREVPGHDLAANLIGFTGADHTGLEGMEARYDDVLRGRNGQLIYEAGLGRDLDKEIPGGYHKETPAQPGKSLVLTIDRDMQYEAQRVLAARARHYRASVAAAVVLDVRTGEVLAQASYPAYDAADWQDAKPTDREDVATSVTVDPGSVHKAITIGAALQEGAIKPDTIIRIGPKISRGGIERVDHPAQPNNTAITIPGILEHSSNVGTIKVADLLGAQKLYEYQRKFGLGQATGEGTLGEVPGIVRPPDQWTVSSSASIPIGLGVAVTPLQMAAAYAAIANGGTWVQPHLVRQVLDTEGAVISTPTPESHPVLSPQVAGTLRAMMESVVQEGGTGHLAAIPGYRVAGKTGTGQRVVSGRYVAGEVASFVGMAPADAPRFVVAVFAATPGGTGGVVAAPAFREIMASALSRYKVPPTGTKAPTFVDYPGRRPAGR